MKDKVGLLVCVSFADESDLKFVWEQILQNLENFKMSDF